MTQHRRLPPLPGLLGVIAETVSYGAALQVAAAEGGKRLYIPHPDAMTPDHWLARVIGLDAARLVAQHYAIGSAAGRGSGDRVVVPLGPTGSRAKRWQELRRALEAGGSSNDVARLFGLDERTVRRHKVGDSGKGRRPDPRQIDLLD